MRGNQSLLVLGLVAAVAAVGIGVVAFRSADSHRDIMLGALQRGMEHAYDQALAETPRPNPEQSCSLQTSALRTVLLGAKEQHAIFPTFVNLQDVFLPLESVLIPSDELVCVVRVGDARLYGITGKRAWREVNPGEFGKWPHESLATNAPATQ